MIVQGLWLETHQPLFVALEAILVEPLHGDDDSGAGLCGGEGLLVDPAFEDGAEAAFSEHAVGPEIPGGHFEVHEIEALHIRRLQYLALAPRSRRHRRHFAALIPLIAHVIFTHPWETNIQEQIKLKMELGMKR